MCYLRSTKSTGFVLESDDRDSVSSLWLELWCDADHAGRFDRKSTGGWVLILRGEHGTYIPLDWGSKSQATVARSSGESEVVALRDAVLHVGATCKAMSSCAIPSLMLLEAILGMNIPLRVMVDSSTCKVAAEKGTTRNMKYITKTQGVDLMWLRDVLSIDGISLRKVSTHDNVADIMTKHLDGVKVRNFVQA